MGLFSTSELEGKGFSLRKKKDSSVSTEEGGNTPLDGQDEAVDLLTEVDIDPIKSTEEGERVPEELLSVDGEQKN